MAKNRGKKPKQEKKPQNKVVKKKKKNLHQKKKKKFDKTLAPPAAEKVPQDDSDSDTDSESESEPSRIQKLLEPYTKDQLIDFVADAAIADASLYARIAAAADRDVSHRKVFVYGLGWDTTREALTAAFEPFGAVEDCNVVVDRATGKAKGFAFVLFESRRGAVRALREPRKRISNRIASCQLASAGPGSSSSGGGHDSLGRKIYVSNVQADVDPEKLRAFFARFGEIELGPIGFDMQSGKSRGFALFVYKTPEGARKVLEEPYKIFEGHQLHCQKASDGKNKVGPAQPAASITTAVQPVQSPVFAAMAAAQNLALFSQYPGLHHPMYNAMLGNPNGGLMAHAGSVNPIVAPGGLSQGVLGTSQVGAGSLGSVPAGFGGYGASTSHGLGGFGGNSSVLGAYGTYGSSGSTGKALQQAYQSSQIGQPSPAKAPGIGGSFGGYPSYTGGYPSYTR